MKWPEGLDRYSLGIPLGTLILLVISSFIARPRNIHHTKDQIPVSDNTFWQNFWPSFWAEFCASFIVGIIITAAISWIIGRNKKVRAKVYSQKVRLDESSVRLSYYVRNTGNVSFKPREIYWHLFVEEESYLDPHELSASLVEAMPELAKQRSKIIINGKNFIHYCDLIDAPLFVGRNKGILTFDYAAERNKQFAQYYYLSTAYGLFPKDLETKENGEVSIKSVWKVGHVESLS